MKASFGLVVLAVVLSTSCGALNGGDDTAQTEVARQFLIWNPGDALINEHTSWHYSPCGAPPAPRCTQQGEDFLTFHRNFMERLRDEYERQGLTADITAWTALPPEMKNPANGWTAALQDAENHIQSLIDPLTGTFFASVDRFGSYVQSFYHGDLHSIAANAYGESQLSSQAMSPKSTYFFKIHGLIDAHYQRFMRGDFNKDGQSDLVVRSGFTGANQIWLMNGTTAVQKANITSVTGNCGFYVGATADLNFDGNVDLVWHGPNCSAVWIWIMNGTTHVGDVQLPNVGADWTLLGSGDFDRDGRPDLVWKNNTSLDLSIWKLNGTSYVTYYIYDVPANYRPIAVGDISDDLKPDIVLQQIGVSPNVYRYVAGNGAFTFFLPAIMAGTIDAASTPSSILGGVGRLSAGRSAADLVFFNGNITGPQPIQVSRWRSLSGSQANYDSVTGETLLDYWTVQGPR